MTRERLTLEELYKLFKSCRQSVFRLEALQDYAPLDEDDAARRRAFHEGQALPERSTRSHQFTRELVDAGKRLVRVHVVDLPLTPYLQYELTAYSENIAAGEDVRITDRSAHPDLAELTQDFMLIDNDTGQPVVVWYRHSRPDERILGWDRSDEPDDIARCRAQRDLALAHSVSLKEYRAIIDTE